MMDHQSGAGSIGPTSGMLQPMGAGAAGAAGAPGMGGTVLPGMGAGLPAVNAAGGIGGGGGMNPLLGGAGMPHGLGLHGVPGGAGGAFAGSQGGGPSGGVVPGGGLSVAANVLSAQQRMFNSVGAAWRPGLPSSAAFQSQQQMHDGSNNAPPMPVLVSALTALHGRLLCVRFPQLMSIGTSMQ